MLKSLLISFLCVFTFSSVGHSVEVSEDTHTISFQYSGFDATGMWYELYSYEGLPYWMYGAGIKTDQIWLSIGESSDYSDVYISSSLPGSNFESSGFLTFVYNENDNGEQTISVYLDGLFWGKETVLGNYTEGVTYQHDDDLVLDTIFAYDEIFSESQIYQDYLNYLNSHPQSNFSKYLSLFTSINSEYLFLFAFLILVGLAGIFTIRKVVGISNKT